jgi:hypothetical protein
MQEKGKSVEYRALRTATVRTHWPRLLSNFERKRTAAAGKVAKKGARGCA